MVVSTRLRSGRLRLAATVLACASPTPYPAEVLAWLDAQRVAWRPLELAGASGPVVTLFKGAADEGECALALHLLASPRRAADVRPAWSNARLTDACASHGSPSVLVHLHEDVWRSRGEIVRARLLARSGRVSSRLFARSTTVRRIPAAEYIPFLDSNHLWGATKAKYGYGLFDKEGELVAVATFSARRRVLRAGVPHASHELLRTCCRRDGAVVGGISKLVRAFVRAQGADDVVTVVDRDWGTAAGWHGMGFETVQLMPPLPMVVGLDGVRRHLVGAGPVPLEGVAPVDGGDPSGSEAPLRAAPPLRVMQGLSLFDAAEHDPRSPLAWLMENEMYPLHDAGVERLMMLTHGGGSKGGAAEPGAALAAWEQSVPTYASEHYSSNPGVAALLVAAARRPTGGGSGAVDAAITANHAASIPGGLGGGDGGGVGGGVEGGGDEGGLEGGGGGAEGGVEGDSLATSGEGGSGGGAPTDVALPPPDDVPVLLDEPLVREAMESWKAATAGGEGAARLVFVQASAMAEEEGPAMGRTEGPTALVTGAGEAAAYKAGARIQETGARIEVHARPGGWRSLRVVNGKRHVLQSVVRLLPDESADPSAVVSECLRAMAALAFAALDQTPVGSSPSSTRHDIDGVPQPVQKISGQRTLQTDTLADTTPPPVEDQRQSSSLPSMPPVRNEAVEEAPLRCLHLGLGGGVLARLVAQHAPRSRHSAVEVDAAVVAATEAACGGFALGGGGGGALHTITVHTADAVAWVADASAEGRASRPVFDVCFIDCFDGDNACPPGLHSDAFLAQLALLLDPERGLVVHNLHFGAAKLAPRLAAAEQAYARAFGDCVRVNSLDSKPWAGNALLCATVRAGGLHGLHGRAEQARRRRGTPFDLVARVRGARAL